jgi:hypothetical protein
MNGGGPDPDFSLNSARILASPLHSADIRRPVPGDFDQQQRRPDSECGHIREFSRDYSLIIDIRAVD